MIGKGPCPVRTNHDNTLQMSGAWWHSSSALQHLQVEKHFQHDLLHLQVLVFLPTLIHNGVQTELYLTRIVVSIQKRQ